MRPGFLLSVCYVDPTGDGPTTGYEAQVDLERIPTHRSHEFSFVAGVWLFRLHRATELLRLLCHWVLKWAPHGTPAFPSSSGGWKETGDPVPPIATNARASFNCPYNKTRPSLRTPTFLGFLLSVVVRERGQRRKGSSISLLRRERLV
ncbi:hypothetical protein MUK42_36357 [Musa troglodytarum]|uniref:Uncharacterized protein n=1 Tax=Musa troglodytarum TaxID=320322 RepID=A0A9E7FPN1_9LILI|nr:hypothetical protein MUK42_36357 [Musa troglodytarum]